MARRKLTKKQFFKFFTQYGIHIWAILIIANAVMVYTYHFASHAAGKNDTTIALALSSTPSPSGQISTSPSPSTEPSPSSGPQGPMINISFTLPDIGSGGGVMKPLHQQRNVTVYLYAPNVNSMDPAVNPLYTIQGTATYDSNPDSPTYTTYLNPSFSLGSSVQDGSYQVAYRTDLSFTTLIKQNASDIGGETFDLSSGNNNAVVIPTQTLLMGDIIPSGNNFSFTINDYNAFINCYGDKNTTSSFCKGKNYGDFNDDGVIDGIDFNILLRSLGGLVAEGQTLPQITIEPTISLPRPTMKLVTHPTPTSVIKKTKTTATQPASPSAKTTKSSGGAGGIIAFLIILIILGVGGFFVFRNEKLRATILALIHLSPTGTPAEATNEATEEETQTEQTDSAEQAQPEVQQETPAPLEPAPPAAAQPAPTEIPTAAPTPISPLPAAANSVAGIVEKDCYVKVKGPDDARTGSWLLLTDDNGAVNAHYSKNDAQDGFAKVKGVMKTENGKTFMEITELIAE